MSENTKKKARQKNDPEKEMTFWQHLEELRWHIVRSVLVIVAMTIVALIYKTFIFDHIILAPKDSDFITYRLLCKLADLLSVQTLCLRDLEMNIINLSMGGQFTMHVYVSIATGLILATPYIIWEFWRFIRPALKMHERKYASITVLIMSVLFLVGILFSYYVLVPWALYFFGTYQVSEAVLNQISLKSYISTVVTLTFGMGFIFELPVIVYFLTKIGIMTPAFMKKNRKYAFILILIVAAIITPPDVFSQIIATIPLYALYELSIYVSKRVYKKRSLLQG
ncbi:MAG: twin-arginine translocase subunit TatC [Bacteroidetes bacterium]|nr:twin-arginine translocase subunit TatC [Bacteroidota bacterium]